MYKRQTLDGAYLAADALGSGLSVALNAGGLRVTGEATLAALSGEGELRIPEGASLAVAESAEGSFALMEYAGTELDGEMCIRDRHPSGQARIFLR